MLTAILGPVALAELSGRDRAHLVANLMVLAVVPLFVDVVRLVRRRTWPRRSGRRLHLWASSR